MSKEKLNKELDRILTLESGWYGWPNSDHSSYTEGKPANKELVERLRIILNDIWPEKLKAPFIVLCPDSSDIFMEWSYINSEDFYIENSGGNRVTYDGHDLDYDFPLDSKEDWLRCFDDIIKYQDIHQFPITMKIDDK